MTPYFDASTRFEQRKAATLKFMAQRGKPAVLASGEDLSVSVFHLPGRQEARLPVRELGGGMYEAEFVPDLPGDFALTVSSGGQPAHTTAPVALAVVETPGEGAAAFPDGREVESESAARSRLGASGGSRRGR